MGEVLDMIAPVSESNVDPAEGVGALTCVAVLWTWVG